jgi:FkbM family methyltransferase
MNLRDIIPFKKQLKLLAWRFKMRKLPDIVWIQGFKMFIKKDEDDINYLKTLSVYANERIYDSKITQVIKAKLKDGDTFIDIGASMGYFTLLAKTVGKDVKVYAFEPEPKNMSYFKYNIWLNQPERVYFSRDAVSDKTGEEILYKCPYGSDHHIIKHREGISEHRKCDKIEEIKIKTVRVDDVVKEKVDLIKMDIEGAEPLAIAGMDEILKQKNVKMIMEFFPFLIRKMGFDPLETLNVLGRYGFSIVPLRGSNIFDKKFLESNNLHDDLYLEKHGI